MSKCILKIIGKETVDVVDALAHAKLEESSPQNLIGMAGEEFGLMSKAFFLPLVVPVKIGLRVYNRVTKMPRY